MDVVTSELEHAPSLQQCSIQEAVTLPHVFCVISWGCAATTWLAHVLNSHPDIFCTHASNSVWHTHAGARRVDGIEYLEIIRIQGRTCLATGDVHGISRFTIPELNVKFGSEFSAAVLVRGPMARLTSQLAMFENYYAEYQSDDLSYIDHLAGHHGLDLPDREQRTKLFVHGVNMLNAITEEVAVGPIFRQEDITSQPASLRSLVDHLTAGKVPLSDVWCQQAVETRVIRPHAQSRQVFVPWGWQLDTFRKVVSPEAWRIYAELGYPRPSFL